MPETTACSLRVSLVATVLNEAKSLPALLASIDLQIREPDEVVIVDGGSSDGSLDLMDRWAATRTNVQIISAPGTNIAQGRNLAISTAHGEIVAVTDAGVELDPEWLEKLAEPFYAAPTTDVAAGFFVSRPRTSFEHALGATTLPNVGEIDSAQFLPSSRSVAFRREAWEAAGGYPQWLDYCEDVVFDQALRRLGKRFVWTPDAVVAFRPRPTLLAFFKQYFRYARGDGKADLWRHRHAIRYVTYLVGLPLAWRARTNPLVFLLTLAAAVGYVRGPILRLWRDHRDVSRLPCTEVRQPSRTTLPRLVGGLAWIPLLRLTGDVAKMLGYPCGIAWRLTHGRPVH